MPIDLVTTSASGLDPHLSPASAANQVPWVARERGVGRADLQRLVDAHTEGRQFGFLGEPVVNVLELNLALDTKVPKSHDRCGVAARPRQGGRPRATPRVHRRRPGRGKTYQMLEDAHELKRQGMDVVVGFVEPRPRGHVAQIRDLERCRCGTSNPAA